MKIYRYWAKAAEKVRRDQQEWNVQCFGGSDHSVDEALQHARQRVQRVAAAISTGMQPAPWSVNSDRHPFIPRSSRY